jgi:hypothetical protein
MEQFQSDGNPNGWVPGVGTPEVDGYTGVLAELRDRQQSYSRVLLWSPTGLQRGQFAKNYPFNSFSRWRDPVVANSRLPDGPAALRHFSAVSDSQFGLWWGNAASPRNSWNDHTESQLDMSLSSHRELMTNELSAAVDAGARFIGLDAFAHSEAPLWNLVAFLEFARAKYPNLGFCTEGRSCDILHSFAPTCTDAYVKQDASLPPYFRGTAPFTLATYINPGQETWCLMNFDANGVGELFGERANRSRQREAIATAIANGYTPVVFERARELVLPGSGGGASVDSRTSASRK